MCSLHDARLIVNIAIFQNRGHWSKLGINKVHILPASVETFSWSTAVVTTGVSSNGLWLMIDM